MTVSMSEDIQGFYPFIRKAVLSYGILCDSDPSETSMAIWKRFQTAEPWSWYLAKLGMIEHCLSTIGKRACKPLNMVSNYSRLGQWDYASGD